MKSLVIIKRWLNALIRLLFPKCCVVCGLPLAEGEDDICIHCNINLPRTNFHLAQDNPVEQLFWGKIPIVRATAFFFYHKGSDYKQLLYLLKYNGQKELGRSLGRIMASEIIDSGFFEGIDWIVPIPLHEKKERQRGYNQSEYIAKGVADLTGLPIASHSVRRLKNTETQTHKSADQRWENVDGIFDLIDPTSFEKKHILIVDDVLTTGATTTACASAFSEVKGIKISILTLAIAE